MSFYFYCQQMKFVKVMFLQLSVSPRGGVHGRRKIGVCVVGGMCGRGLHAGGACMADGRVCGRGGRAWQGVWVWQGGRAW